MKESLDDAWQTYRALMLHPNAGPVQINVARRAFYAGAGKMLSISVESAGSDTQDAAILYMFSIQQELDAFMQAMKDGRA